MAPNFHSSQGRPAGYFLHILLSTFYKNTVYGEFLSGQLTAVFDMWIETALRINKIDSDAI